MVQRRDVTREETGPGAGSSWRRPVVVGACLHLLVSVPLLVSLVAFHHPRWHPLTDLALTELRVRDVGTARSPLIGLPGRIGSWSDSGSHPGPLSFWALAPVHRLLGGTAFAFSAAGLVLHLVAFAVVLWLAHRRGAIPLMVAMAAAGALLVRAYGSIVFLEPWNPYLPVMWWLVFLLAVWSVADGDGPALVVAVVAGSFCAQTHLAYLGSVGLLTLGMALWWARPLVGRTRGSPPARRHRLRYLGAATLVGLVLWAPTMIDQVAGTQNLGKIQTFLQHPEQPPAGLVTGAEDVVDRFGVDYWLSSESVGETPASAVRHSSGVVVLGLWGVSAIACWAKRVGTESLRRLHGVLAAGVLVVFVSASRISGARWFYLYLSIIGLATLCLVATGWTAALAVRDRITSVEDGARVRRAAVLGALAFAVLVSGLALAAAPSVQPSSPEAANDLGVVADQTAVALRGGKVPGGGAGGRYLVRWDDPTGIGAQGAGLVNELERAGFDVGIDREQGIPATPHRVMALEEATAVVMLAVGPAIDAWDERDRGAGGRVAYADPRSPAQIEDQARRADRIDEMLRERGDHVRLADWRRSPFAGPLDPGLDRVVRDEIAAYLAVPSPVAVFVVHPDQVA